MSVGDIYMRKTDGLCGLITGISSGWVTLKPMLHTHKEDTYRGELYLPMHTIRTRWKLFA